MKNTFNAILVLLAGFSAIAACADVLTEDEIGTFEERYGDEVEVEIDLRTVFPVAKLVDDPALRGITYSARGWRLEVPVEDSTRSAMITAIPGSVINGYFSPEGAQMTVLASTTGEGTVDWHPSSIQRKVYQLLHSARVGGVDDAFAACRGYLDFTECEQQHASIEDVEEAVLGAVTHPIVTVQDERFPWQPIGSAGAGSGIATDVGLVGVTTTTEFSFEGRGVLYYEYALTGGSLTVRANGKDISTFAEPVDWQSCEVRFEGVVAHRIAFVFAATGGGATAALRGVRWVVADEDVRVQGDGSEVIVDLREGVRTPKRSDEILPFVYSSTNWIGDVKGATAESKARVTIVQMKGSDPEVSSWTEEVSDTFRELANESGEGEARKWKPKKGVWKATFDILNGDTSIYSEDAWFDLRKTSTPGFMLMVF